MQALRPGFANLQGNQFNLRQTVSQMSLRLRMLEIKTYYVLLRVLYENVCVIKHITIRSYLFSENLVCLLTITITCNFQTLPLTHGARLFEFLFT